MMHNSSNTSNGANFKHLKTIKKIKKMETKIAQKQGRSTIIVEFDFEKLIIKSHRNN